MQAEIDTSSSRHLQNIVNPEFRKLTVQLRILAAYAAGERNPYNLLGIAAGVSDASFNKAWRNLSACCHPDSSVECGVYFAVDAFKVVMAAKDGIKSGKYSWPKTPTAHQAGGLLTVLTAPRPGILSFLSRSAPYRMNTLPES